jgi:hypothetical protein
VTSQKSTGVLIFDIVRQLSKLASIAYKRGKLSITNRKFRLLKNGSIIENKVIATKTLRHQEKQAVLVKSTLVPWCLDGST